MKIIRHENWMFNEYCTMYDSLYGYLDNFLADYVSMPKEPAHVLIDGIGIDFIKEFWYGALREALNILLVRDVKMVVAWIDTDVYSDISHYISGGVEYPINTEVKIPYGSDIIEVMGTVKDDCLHLDVGPYWAGFSYDAKHRHWLLNADQLAVYKKATGYK